MKYPIEKTEEQWKAQLGPERYRILRGKGTEFPHSGQYNLHFEKGRRHFIFRPTLGNDSAPAFEIFVENEQLVIKGHVDESLEHQAKEKVREILNNRIFDHF